MIYLWLALGIGGVCLLLYVLLAWWIHWNLSGIPSYDDLEEAEHRAEAEAWAARHR